MATMPLQPLSDQPSLKSRHQLAALREMKFAASVVTTNAKTSDPSGCFPYASQRHYLGSKQCRKCLILLT